jgi:hypothetical protein
MNFQAADNIVGIDAALAERPMAQVIVGHSPALNSNDNGHWWELLSWSHNRPFRNIIKAEPAAHTFVGQRSKMDERFGLETSGRRHIELGRSPYGDRKFGNPCAEKVSAHRSRQNKGAASLTKAHGAFRKIGEAVVASEPDACAGVGSPRQGTLTITGSNVRLGAEMPVALSLF